jgi:Flp pilus assembly pilin Flp
MYATKTSGQSLSEVAVALALVSLVVLGTLSLFGGTLQSLYGSLACKIDSATSASPSPTCSLPANIPLTGPDATVINPSFQVKLSGPSNDFIGGNQCTPDCPWGAKFIGTPNFITGPAPSGVTIPSDTQIACLTHSCDSSTYSYDSYAYSLFSILDKNQCTYGAMAEWLTLHQIPTTHTAWSPDYILNPGTYFDNTYHSIQDNAGSMYALALAAGYTVSGPNLPGVPFHPYSGAMVVYKDYWIADSPNGHIATVVGVSPDGSHYTVVEQNVLYVELNYESGSGFPPYRWNLGGFDIRTASWPDPGVAGFIYGPPGTTLPTDPAIIQTGLPAPTPTPSASPSPSPT